MLDILATKHGPTAAARYFSVPFGFFLHRPEALFFPATIKIWNSLPATAIEASNIDDFKKKIVDYFCINPAID